MIAKPTSPQTIGQVLDRSFRLAAASFRHTWWYALLSGAAGYAATIYQFARGESLQQAMLGEVDATYWVLYVCGMFVSLWFASAIYFRVDAVASGDPHGSAAVSTALRRLPLLILLFILLGLAVAVGLVLIIIPGLILMVSLALAQAIYLLEDTGPIDALNRSHKLIWGHWWRTALIFVVALIIVTVVYLLAAFVATSLGAVLSGGEAALRIVLSTIISVALIGVLLAPWGVSLILNVYWDLKLRKEGGDLTARAQAI